MRNLFWFRRDLRFRDNKGLFNALQSGKEVLCLFIFDRNILDFLENKNDRRVSFIYTQLREMHNFLISKGSGLVIKYGYPDKLLPEIWSEYNISEIFCNEDYEPFAVKRDNLVKKLAEQNGILWHSYKDHVVFNPEEVLKDDGKPYIVFTPYSKKWKSKLSLDNLREYNSTNLFSNLYKFKADSDVFDIESIGFSFNKQNWSLPSINDELIRNYEFTRDQLAIDGTSRLSVHLRFGTISIRRLVEKSITLSEVYLNELIWREFYQMIIWFFPQVVDKSFKNKYEFLPWRNNEEEFAKWCKGETGYGIVDAAMHQLNETGWMHNRARMITASFLTKHLIIDWRWGESYFAEKLLDYELASNNGGWQWAAGTGCDAVPYFRVFNPYRQQERFDPEGKYLKKWNGESGLPEIIAHKEARERYLTLIKTYLKQNNF
jgi:deoxyribodipyrimidine photo-lyase